jgi:hypothetical protein
MATLTELTGEMPADVEPAYHKSKHVACQFFVHDRFNRNDHREGFVERADVNRNAVPLRARRRLR